MEHIYLSWYSTMQKLFSPNSDLMMFLNKMKNKMKHVIAPFAMALFLDMKGGEQLEELTKDECLVSRSGKAADMSTGHVEEYINVVFVWSGGDKQEIKLPVDELIAKKLAVGFAPRKFTLQELWFSVPFLESFLSSSGSNIGNDYIT